MWGVDNTLLPARRRRRGVRAVRVGIADGWRIDRSSTALVPDGEATPVDFGDVCVNYDIAWFAEHGSTRRPRSTTSSTRRTATCSSSRTRRRRHPAWRSCSPRSPSTARRLAAVLGGLRANGVEVVDCWTQAYYERFTGAAAADRRRSWSATARSPPAEVVFADPPRTMRRPASIEATCFRQVEFAGVLRGTDEPDAAAQLVDFLVSAAVPDGAAAEPVRVPDEPRPSAAARVHRVRRRPGDLTLDRRRSSPPTDDWIDEWTELVLR